MKRNLLVFAGVLLASSAAMAQDNVIRVVQPDGTEAVMELPSADSYTMQKRAPEVPEAPAPVKVIEKVHEESGVSASQVVEKPVDPPVDVPVRQQPQTVSTLKAAPKPPKPKAKAKPVPPKESGMAQVVAPQPEAVPGNVVVDEKLAKRIALQIAPPAKDMSVLYRTYEGKAAYLVRFRTEEGLFDVLVDMVSGDILATKEH